jgi:mannose-6-phosphate isomerase
LPILDEERRLLLPGRVSALPAFIPTDGALHYISGAVQNYAWGKIGSDSIVARLNNASQPWEKIDEGKPYAEFWYATHPNGMSRVLPTPTSASAAEPPSPASCPDIQSSLLAGEPLPYIFKFLSINGALSLQAHPDKTLATRLHASYPDLYKDPNHKPELVVALSPMEALCGFRPLHEVAIFAAEIPEFAELLGDSAAALAPYATGANTAAATESVDAADASARSVLRDAFATAMRAPEAVVARLSAALAARLSAPSARPPAVSAALAATVASLSQQYPGDVGVFGPLLLNVLTIAPGQSVFLEPNAPHAYLYGECVEVLACSDNVVRVGLTPKFRDVETLVAMLSYSTATPRLHAGAPVDVPSFLTAAPATNSTATAAAAAAAAAAGTDDDTVAPAAAVSAAAVSAAAAAARLGLFAELSRVYAPPETFPEFMVTVTTVPPVAAAAAAAANAAGPPVDADQETEGTRPVPLPVLAGPSVLVCTAGTGSVSFDTDVLCSSSSTTAADAATAAGTDGRSLPLSFGSAILVPAGAAVSVRAHAAAGLTVFRGSANVSAVAQLCTEYSVQHAIRSPAAVPYADAGADAAAGTAHAE